MLATKRTPQIVPAGIARMGEKKDPAVPTAGQTAAQFQSVPENPPQQTIVSQHQGPDRNVATVPARPELEPPLQPDREKTNSSLRLLMYEVIAPFQLPAITSSSLSAPGSI
jgi:hypothetical protein